jgi:hypothetical protein
MWRSLEGWRENEGITSNKRFMGLWEKKKMASICVHASGTTR